MRQQTRTSNLHQRRDAEGTDPICRPRADRHVRWTSPPESGGGHATDQTAAASRNASPVESHRAHWTETRSLARRTAWIDTWMPTCWSSDIFSKSAVVCNKPQGSRSARGLSDLDRCTIRGTEPNARVRQSRQDEVQCYADNGTRAPERESDRSWHEPRRRLGCECIELHSS